MMFSCSISSSRLDSGSGKRCIWSGAILVIRGRRSFENSEFTSIWGRYT